MNIQRLRAKIVEREMNVEQLAEIIGMTGPTLYRKLRAPLKITIGEAIQMKDVLELTDEEALDIFLF
jgi:DNA-binding transcriptional ArsR family regulator